VRNFPRHACFNRAAPQPQEQARARQSDPLSPLINILENFGNSFGARCEVAGDGIASLLDQIFPREQPRPTASSASSSAPDESPKESVHHHIICDGCGVTPIKGLRYKCTVCPDYDLCATCEAKNEHPETHPLLKIHAPVQYGHSNRHSHGHSHGRCPRVFRGCPAFQTRSPFQSRR
jgi:hypothetical protein